MTPSTHFWTIRPLVQVLAARLAIYSNSQASSPMKLTTSRGIATAASWSFSLSLSSEYNASLVSDLTVPQTTIDAFRKDGFAVFPKVLEKEDVSILNERLEYVLRGDFDRGMPPDKTPKRIKAPYDKDKALGFSGNTQNVKVLQVINVHKADTTFRRLAVHPALGKVVAKLGGWKGARMAQDQVWAKPAGAPPLTFHRDSPYFMFTPSDVITVWVALDTMDPEIGPLEYARASHLWGDSRTGAASHFFEADGGMSLLSSAASREGIDDVEIVSLAGLEAGGISIHDGRTWHGSSANQSKSRPRRGLGLHFVPEDIRFTETASQSRLWESYVENVDDPASVPITDDDFPLTWKH